MTWTDFAKGKSYAVLGVCVIADNGKDHSHKTDGSHYNYCPSIHIQVSNIPIDFTSLPYDDSMIKQEQNLMCI
jgi:hypothetical protein